VLGTTEYGERFATMVSSGPVCGVQFHPEKSSAHGLRLLSSFLALCAARRSTATVAPAAPAARSAPLART
jgi:imidazole glycerol-phosphate synthase subunit HisH